MVVSRLGSKPNAEPDSSDADDILDQYVGKQLTPLGMGQHLFVMKPERREGGEASQKAYEENKPLVVVQLAFGKESPEDAKDKATQEIDQHGSPREGFADEVFERFGDSIAKQ